MEKQRKLVSKSQRNKRKILVNIFKVFLVLIITVIIAGAGAAFGMMKGILDNAPDIDSINIVPKGFKSVIYDADGNIQREISTVDSNREYVFYDEISPNLINAFVAIEDERYWTHNGIDMKGIFRVAIRGIATRDFDQGASTITQQLIKNNVFNVGLDETTFMDKLERKIQEQYLALELEKRYGKQQILELYLNTIYLGRGYNGVQAAAEGYFGKTVDKLTVSECAAIAGITKNPSAYDPVEFPEQSAERREVVLNKMLELEYITEAEYNIAINDKVYDRIEAHARVQREQDTVYTYYEDTIIDNLIADFCDIYNCTPSEASMMIYTGGYQVYSVQDKKIQKICDDVINDPSYVDGATVGLDYQLTIIDKDKEERNFSMENMISYFKITTGKENYNNIYPSEEDARAAASEYKDYILKETGGTMVAERFTISPQPQFSMTLMDQKTGYVKAIVGGKGEKTVNRGLNRATNSPRQPGSTFKILASYLPFIDTDMGGVASNILDEAFKYDNGISVENWNGYYKGYCTVRDGIKDSMNVLAVKVITMVTPEVAFEYLLDLGLTTLADGTKVDYDGTVLSDVTQSAALGGLTYGVTTYEMTAAYASIANAGIYIKPAVYSKVLDHDGNVIIDNTKPEELPTTKRVMKETTAWQLIDCMRSVLSAGTGGPAKMRTGIDCAGKTGTTSSAYDLWFAGMSPYYTGAIWMGFDYNTSMNNMNQGIHEVIWRDIMDQIAEAENQDKELVIMEQPKDVEKVTICKQTNLLPGDGCTTTTDYYAKSAIPKERCSGHEYITICTESKQLATKKCKDTKNYIVKTRESGEKVLENAPEDVKYTNEKCELHPEEKNNKYTVTTSASDGGSISKGGTYNKGDSITIYITPKNGYSINDVMVNGESVGPVSRYEIVDINEDIDIQVRFRSQDDVEYEPEEPTVSEESEPPEESEDSDGEAAEE